MLKCSHGKHNKCCKIIRSLMKCSCSFTFPVWHGELLRVEKNDVKNSSF